MKSNESKLREVCKTYNNYENDDFKGDLLYKAFEDFKYEEELLASYITPKQKFDCIYGFLLTNTRIIEISSYTTMYTITIKRYKQIKKVILEREIDDSQAKNVLLDEAKLERVQVRLTFIDCNNQEEEFVWENIESEESIDQAIDFANKVFEQQYKE